MMAWKLTGICTALVTEPGELDRIMCYDIYQRRPVFKKIYYVFDRRNAWVQEERNVMVSLIGLLKDPFALYARCAMQGIELRHGDPLPTDSDEERLIAEQTLAAKKAFQQFRSAIKQQPNLPV